MTETAPTMNLASLLRASGDASIRGELTELRYEQGGEEQVLSFAEPAPYRIDVNTLSGDELYLSGRFSPTLIMECARCLRRVDVPLDLKLGTLMRYQPGVSAPHIDEAESGEEVLVFGSPQLDFSAFLAESAIVAAPLSVLHDPECQGLCQVCGTDLNEATCAHVARVPVEVPQPQDVHLELDGSPFAALRGLDLPEE